MRAWLRSEKAEFTPVEKGEEFGGECAQLLWMVGERHQGSSRSKSLAPGRIATAGSLELGIQHRLDAKPVLITGIHQSPPSPGGEAAP
eukprot:5793875-Amphidinium_carterae.1